jgi:hypothetical protein
MKRQLAGNEYFCLTVARKYRLDVPLIAWPRTALRWSLTVSICAWRGPIVGLRYRRWLQSCHSESPKLV